MFAVIRTGGKQYKVAKDEVIAVEKLDFEPGEELVLDEVLMVGGDGVKPATGAPAVAGASVTVTVVEHKLADKVLIFMKKRRHNYRRKRGHRQPQTLLRVTGISAGGK